VFAHKRLLSFLLAIARVFRGTGLPALLGRIRAQAMFPFAMLASTRREGTRSAAAEADAGTLDRGTASVLTGCVMEGLFAPANRATERALSRNGYRLVETPSQVCCGALHAHAGDDATARRLARENVAAFEASGSDFIAVNSAGCGAMLKEYGHLLEDDPEWSERAARVSSRVRDISELLAAAGPAPSKRKPVKVTYDAPCHLLHGQRVSAQPIAVLGAVEGLTLVPLAASDQCCGSAGIFNLIEPDVADAVLAPKIAAIVATGADVAATGNPGCLMQIGAGLLRAGSPIRARHPVELLAD
jgi:glycolate oxidase iron-sulfur subunit